MLLLFCVVSGNRKHVNTYVETQRWSTCIIGVRTWFVDCTRYVEMRCPEEVEQRRRSKESWNNDFVERETRGRNRVGKFYTIMKLVFSLPVAFVYIVGLNPIGFFQKKQERLFLFLIIIQWKPRG